MTAGDGGIMESLTPNTPSMRVAVIGGGVAGIVAAHVLQRRHEVVLFEKNDYLGGHTHTVVLTEGPDAGAAVDTGFIVLNDHTYPIFHRFLAQLEVPVRFGDMSFGFHSEPDGRQYAGTSLNGLFAQRIADDGAVALQRTDGKGFANKHGFGILHGYSLCKAGASGCQEQSGKFTPSATCFQHLRVTFLQWLQISAL